MRPALTLSKATVFLVSILTFLLTPKERVYADWQSVGALNVPELSYSFLATTPGGELLAATFNNVSMEDKLVRDLPALLIRNPNSATPEVRELLSVPFSPQRGYGGIASDTQSNIYVSGDTGDPGTSFLRKYKPDGTLDTNFGIGGEVRPNKRCLGVETMGDYVILLVDWGVLHVYNSQDGSLVGKTDKPSRPGFVRDISIDLKSQEIFGVAQGGITMWRGGTPWNPQDYSYQSIIDPRSDPRSGEGIFIDPLTRNLLITPIPGNTLFDVKRQGGYSRATIHSANRTSHLCDSATSFNGAFLYISDIKSRKIHVMRRPEPSGSNNVSLVASQGNGKVRQTTSENLQNIEWHKSFVDVVEEARENRKPMFVYFMVPGVTACEDFQNNVLLTEEFKQVAQDFVCVFENVKENQHTAYRFGAYRVPHVTILDSVGETTAEFTYNIPQDQLFDTMNATF